MNDTHNAHSRDDRASVFHLTFSTRGRNPMVQDEAARRRVVRTIGRLAGSETVLFHLVDEHLHLVAMGSRRRTEWLAHGLLRALRTVAAAHVEPAYIQTVSTRAHMQRLVPYLLRQTTHHGLPAHPALWSGSCFADLVGARVIPGLRLRLGDALPRITLRQVYQDAGIQRAPGAPLSMEGVRRAGADHLVQAAAAAMAAPPALRGNERCVVVTRRVVAHLASEAGVRPSDAAWALGITPRALRRLRARALDPALPLAVRRYLSLEAITQEVSPSWASLAQAPPARRATPSPSLVASTTPSG